MKSKIRYCFSRDRKILYMILSIALISVFSLTIVYAALSVTLNIRGNAELVASTWDVHLDNVKVARGSVSGVEPSIINATTATFSTTLNMPGDFYEFTIDVVNDGSIDAMIDSVTKTPTLTTEQAKYLNYIVEYENGGSINTKQLVEKNSFVRLRVRVEFRKDIIASDMPTISETLDLAFNVNYIQSDGSNENVSIDNNGKYMKIVSGDLNTVGSEICIGDECFNIIKSNGESVTMLSKMNITTDIVPKQSSSAPTVAFSSTKYWDNNGIKVKYGTDYPAYVYDENSILYTHVENYKIYLESNGAKIDEARLITVDELLMLGCWEDTMCVEVPSWLISSFYWSGSAYLENYIIAMDDHVYMAIEYNKTDKYGIRPVIVLSL